MPQKFKSFSLNSKIPNVAGLSRKEKSDKKKKVQDEEAKKVLDEFVASFGEDEKIKSWVRGGVENADNSDCRTAQEKLYVPKITNALVQASNPLEDLAVLKPKISEKPKLGNKNKRKTQLEIFKEELRQKHDNIDRQKKASEVAKYITEKLNNPNDDKITETNNLANSEQDKIFSTNIFVGNLSPKVNEKMLCQLFGEFGPLACVKIMWPRTDEEKLRCRNFGFIAYMKRTDADACMKELQGYELFGMELNLSWGKTVLLPTTPVYVSEKHQKILEEQMQHISTGLPFNAIPLGKEIDMKNLANSVVKVYIPSDRSVICQIHRTIEYVALYGCQFEAALMNKEFKNPDYKFLFVHTCKEHIYYRWKLYSVLRGDSVNLWRNHDFVMYNQGSVWRPPTNPSLSTLSEEFPTAVNDSIIFEIVESLETLSTDRIGVGKVMVLCMKRASLSKAILDIIMYAANKCTSANRILAFIFLIHDLLYNSQSQVAHAFSFRRQIQDHIVNLYTIARKVAEKTLSKNKYAKFKAKVTDCFRAMSDWSIYPQDFLAGIQNAFIGLEIKRDDEQDVSDDGVDISDNLPVNLVANLLENKRDDQSMGEEESGVENVDFYVKSDKQEDIFFTASKWTNIGNREGQESSSSEDFDGVPIDVEMSINTEKVKKSVPSKEKTRRDSSYTTSNRKSERDKRDTFRSRDSRHRRRK